MIGRLATGKLGYSPLGQFKFSASQSALLELIIAHYDESAPGAASFDEATPAGGHFDEPTPT